uniref:RNA-directed DNA polymerase n=1 Tax=Strongyloides stercoralis TaxID=6248 RepID=A0A0K0EBY1_STRER
MQRDSGEFLIDVFNKEGALCGKEVLMEEMNITSALQQIPVKKEILIEHYNNDNNAQMIIEYIKTKENNEKIPKFLKSYMDYFENKNGILISKSRIYITNSLDDIMLKWLHAIHESNTKMIERTRERFIWENYTTKISKYYASCSLCMKTKRTLPYKISHWPISTSPRERWHMDYAQYGTLKFLVIGDSFSGFIHATKVKDYSLGELYTKLIHVIGNFGCPLILVADNFRTFKSPELQEWLQQYNITLLYSIPYKPQSNSIGEKSVGIIKSFMKKASMDNTKEPLEHAVLKNNNSVKKNGKTALELFYTPEPQEGDALDKYIFQNITLNHKVMYKPHDENIWYEGLAIKQIGPNLILVQTDNNIQLYKGSSLQWITPHEYVNKIIDDAWILNKAKNENKIIASTDGSSKQGRRSAFVIFLENSIVIGKKKISNNATAQTAEVKAFLLLLKYIDSNLNDKSFLVVVDSAYVYSTIKNHLSNWANNDWTRSNGSIPKHIDLWLEIYKLWKNQYMEIIKVQSHSGVTYNDIVDDAAKSAAKSTTYDFKIEEKPLSHIKEIKEES